MRVSIIFSAWLLVGLNLLAQDADPGRVTFENRCARCHGADGGGAEMGPPIARRLATLADPQLTTLIRTGVPGRGMPSNSMEDADMAPLTRYLRSLQARAGARPVVRKKVQLTDGKTLEGVVLNEGFDDLQLQTEDLRIHLLRGAGDRYREVTSQSDWPGYNGDPGGNRYTRISQITPANVGRLGPKWVFNLPNAPRLQVTPVVVEGIMSVAGPNECYALDAGTGRQIWHYQVPAMPSAGGRGAGGGGGNNRGVAVAGNRVFTVAKRTHLLAINRSTGGLAWDIEMADVRDNYYLSSAPLAVGSLVISGIAGGEHGARGFLAAYDQETGKEAWRFWTVPKPGEPGSESWKGKGIDHPGGPTWFTGTYDAQTDTVYWPTGNPSAEYNGDDRGGDNLYADCILALDAKTGKLKWYYQFTPHDLWDWDATETPMLVDADWDGHPRKLLLHGNRNGFFYVLDRTNGKLLLAKPFVRNLTWAKGIGADGRPIMNPNQEPTAAGTKVCPSQDGATNWFSPSYNPATGLFYLQTFEKCSIYTKRDPGEWQSGRQYLGGSQRVAPDGNPERVLKAINIRTGQIAWELAQKGPATSWGGTIATSTGLVIFGEEGGALMAADALTGKVLWSFQTNESWKASPMTYTFDGKQYIAVAAGSHILSFGILE
jgi:alcohol dehydrogenase (cytochrome c)